MSKIFEEAKDFSLGQYAALVQKLGGQEVVKKILSDELFLKFEGVEVCVAKALAKLIDKHGRVIPVKSLQSAVCDPNRDFYLKQPAIDYGQVMARLSTYLQVRVDCSTAEFERRANKLIEQLSAEPSLSNLLKGVYLPILLPQMPVDDYGKVLDEVFLTAVEKAYTAVFPGRPFNNYCKGNLAGKVTIITETRHEQLLAKMSVGAVVGIYFPTAFQGFSIPAVREQMISLPENVVLSGGLDIAMALIMYPEILARDFHTPGLDLAALQWSSADDSLCFKAVDGYLSFGSRGLGAGGYYSGGLLLLG